MKSAAFLVLCVLVAGVLGAAPAPHWSYAETDEEWAALTASDNTLPYAACVGNRQSPLNMVNLVPDPTLKALDTAWADFSTFTVKNNGHTIQVDSTGPSPPKFTDPNTGIVYNFLQFHFHSPSEHTWVGGYRDLEVHLVHKDPTTGNLLVVGVSFISSPYGTNSFLNQFWTNVLTLTTTDAISGTLTSLNFKDAVPSNSQYATYLGSLTTPPCSEIVTWYVMQQSISVSSDQLGAFRTALGFAANNANTFTVSGNARRTQALNGRVIRLSVDSAAADAAVDKAVSINTLAGRTTIAAIVLANVALVLAVVALVLKLKGPKQAAQEPIETAMEKKSETQLPAA